uniref:FAST kinase domains 1 n=1 Tax=Nothobranchius korthausae TaxID=1143690 RepID=A0A1A8GTU8_9TELE
MHRLRCVNPCLTRLLHCGAANRSQILEGLRVCSNEDQVFDVVSRNKAKLTVDHVSCAVRMLWQFQKERPELLRTIDLTKTHPQFLTLQVLAENKIALMSDLMLIDMLYAFLRLKVEPHESLVQQMVSEAWLRVDRLPLPSLSKFSVCLNNQHLQTSPLMGRITSILDQRLSSINNARVLTALMIGVSSLVSPQLRDALISGADQLLHTMDPSNCNAARRAGCRRYQHHLGLAAKERLIELMDTITDPISFTRLFVALAPIASLEIRERLENITLLMADEFNAQQALAVAEALEEIRSRNLTLLNKIASIIQKNLHVYKSLEVARITQALFLLHYQNSELFATLRKTLISFLQRSFYPSEVTMLTRVLSMLPSPWLDEGVVSRVDEVMSQCDLDGLNTISFAVAKWIRNDPSYRHNTHSKYVRLLQRLSNCGRERLQVAAKLDLVLEELKYISGEWFEEMLLEEAIATLNRMMDQVNWSNISELAFFLTRLNHLHPPLMDRMAKVALENIDKIHFSATYATLLPFSILNYEPTQKDELYDACIQRFTPHMSSFDPHLLVLLAYSLAVADRFPEELIREIFNIDFLGKLDCQLESVPDTLNMRTRRRLMELNRAVCLECPEFQVPWFHDSYCEHLQRKGNGSIGPVQQQIHKMLGEVLGGINFVQVAVIAPYFYSVGFECKLDKHLQPLPYSEPSPLQISGRGKVLWHSTPSENIRDELPPGAQRVAVDFLDSRFFCKNSHHIKGEALMRKRHLEILGYHVVQIPHFEWNSMELSTLDARKAYLRGKILG